LFLAANRNGNGNGGGGGGGNGNGGGNPTVCGIAYQGRAALQAYIAANPMMDGLPLVYNGIDPRACGVIAVSAIVSSVLTIFDQGFLMVPRNNLHIGFWKGSPPA
jgi:hypothetical protein